MWERHSTCPWSEVWQWRVNQGTQAATLWSIVGLAIAGHWEMKWNLSTWGRSTKREESCWKQLILSWTRSVLPNPQLKSQGSESHCYNHPMTSMENTRKTRLSWNDKVRLIMSHYLGSVFAHVRQGVFQCFCSVSLFSLCSHCCCCWQCLPLAGETFIVSFLYFLSLHG